MRFDPVNRDDRSYEQVSGSGRGAGTWRLDSNASTTGPCDSVGGGATGADERLADGATSWQPNTRRVGTLRLVGTPEPLENHFIEVTADEAGTVWLFLHSGSRGVGNRIAQHHIRVAADRCAAAGITLPDRDLAYLEEGTPEFDAYLRELRWAQEFARLNREEMMDRVVAAIAAHMGEDVVEAERVNCHHNFTEQETHFGKSVWVSRKGAIRARAGDAGLIPGSMGTASYVVVGKGDPVSLCSSPHGAGREYSRTAARKRFTRDDLRTAMAGIEYRDTDAFLDEIPAAYKDIDRVMADAADLVEVRHVLHQLVNVKGD